MYRVRRRVPVGPIRVIIFILLAASLASAQQNISGAGLSGIVEDQNGSALSGVTLTATRLEANQVQTAVTDSQGRFRFAYLPVGSYEIRAQSDGFVPAVQKLTATVGQASELKFELKISGLSAQVEIEENSSVIDANRTQVAETILRRDVESLPLNGRNFLDLALLVPAVSRTNTGNVQRFAETSAVPGTAKSRQQFHCRRLVRKRRFR